MAFITAEETKVIRNNLKQTYPSFKFSVRNRDHSSVDVVILESPYDFELNGKEYREVNQYHFESGDQVNYDDKIVKQHINKNILRGILKIISAEHWDKSDSMTDYFNCAFYYNLSIGSYAKPYKKVARKTAKKLKRISKKVAPTETPVSKYFPMSRVQENVCPTCSK